MKVGDNKKYSTKYVRTVYTGTVYQTSTKSQHYTEEKLMTSRI